MVFAEEVVARLKEASEIRNRPQAPKPSPERNGGFRDRLPVMDEATIAAASAFDTTPFQSQYVAPEPEPFISSADAELDDAAPIEPVAESFSTETRSKRWQPIEEVPVIEPAFAPVIDEVKPAGPHAAAID